jgi:hypothetical protein
VADDLILEGPDLTLVAHDLILKGPDLTLMAHGLILEGPDLYYQATQTIMCAVLAHIWGARNALVTQNITE